MPYFSTQSLIVMCIWSVWCGPTSASSRTHPWLTFSVVLCSSLLLLGTCSVMLCYVHRVPCQQKFLAHFEQFRANPRAFISPLKTFLGLDNDAYMAAGESLAASIDNFAKQKKSLPTLKIPRELVPKMCSRKDSDKKCNKEVGHRCTSSYIICSIYVCAFVLE
mgnify:FL=1